MKTKTKICVAVAHVMTEAEKHRILKESRPAKDTTIVKEVLKDIVDKMSPVVGGDIIQGIRGVWGHIPSEKLPYRPSPNG